MRVFNPGRCRATSAFVILSALAATPRAAPQDRPPAPLKSGVSLVAIDFLAIGRDGRPVPDLKPDEVTLRIGGRPRPVQSLNLIDVSKTGGIPVSPLPPPYGTNIQSEDSRAFVLVVDDDSFRVGTERALREAADSFLDSLVPTDRVALVTMPYGGTRVDLTTEQEKVRASLAQIVGQGAPNETPDDMSIRTRRTLESLAGLLQGFVGSPSPVTVVFFSASLVGPTRQNVITAGQAIGRAALEAETFQHVGTAAALSGARLYIVEPVGFANQVAGLEHLAGVTGASRLHLGGTEENAFTRILRETSAFYRVAFEPEPSQRNGNVHRVELRVSRPDVTLRVRAGIRIDKTDARANPSPRDLLRQTAVVRDLPLRVTGFASREAGQKPIKVVALAEPIDSSVTLTAAAAGLVDSNGKLVAQAPLEAAQLTGGPIVAAMLVTPGTYRLRFAATDSQGRSGTADYDVEAELRQAGTLQLSSLLLGLSRGSFVPKMQFGSEPVALAYLEIYGGKAGQHVGATFELSRTLNGPPIVTVPGALAASGDHHSVTAAIPIGALPPGDYIVRAMVGISGQAATRVERTLRKR